MKRGATAQPALRRATAASGLFQQAGPCRSRSDGSSGDGGLPFSVLRRAGLFPLPADLPPRWPGAYGIGPPRRLRGAPPAATLWQSAARL